MLLRTLSVSLVILTFGLILLGGFVHSTGSSLACPDWPLCYGQIMPEMKGGVAIEHSHRLFAATIGLLTIFLTILTGTRRKRDRRTWQLAVMALTLVIFQGLLGGLTVIYQLPTAISTAHLATSMIFFSLLLWISLRVFHAGQSSEEANKQGVIGWVKGTTFIVYFQILLGGFVRHTGAALACPDIPFCYGELWPVHMQPITGLHMTHRFLGLLVGLFVITTTFFILKRVRADSRIRFLSMNALFLIVLQIALGFASVWTELRVTIVTAHLAGGALLLATFVALCFFTRSATPLPSGPSDNQ